MKRKRFTAEQIVAVLKQAEVGVPVIEVIRREGISVQTFYRWKKRYLGVEVDQARQFKQLENNRLKQLVADLTLDKRMLQDVLSRVLVARQKRSGVDYTQVTQVHRMRKPASRNSTWMEGRQRLLIQ